ncbi:peroxiredoxin [Roseomonas sp. KE2513]|uniref:peroxiredoxin n=1 Tax=Roseomonas sp. KE2513 TaxID=2479202 RepID=UPI0018E0428A|nr:peroxiredoxin [Roseomonas sp. KE2513]MBI0537312.1 peroxiredoxin [Roseomonas sp. KE2513]
MTLQLGQIAPDFEADTTEGRIRFHEWLGNSWGVIFSHPKNYTPVCTTELGYAAKLKPEFDRRGVKIIGLSVDTVEQHHGWSTDIEETQGAAVNFPMIADPDKKVANLYGMIHPEADASVTVRTVFVIDPNKKIRLMLIYPPSAGRNFDEVLRVVDSLQLTDKHKVATPVNWKPGDRTIVAASLSDEEAKKHFPQGFKTEKPYLRWVDHLEWT